MTFACAAVAGPCISSIAGLTELGPWQRLGMAQGPRLMITQATCGRLLSKRRRAPAPARGGASWRVPQRSAGGRLGTEPGGQVGSSGVLVFALAFQLQPSPAEPMSALQELLTAVLYHVKGQS
jgi:hypothetical protein